MKVYNTEKVKQEILMQARVIINDIEYEIQKYEKEYSVKPDVIELTSNEFAYLSYALKNECNYPVQDIDMNNISFGGIKVIIV